MNKHFRPSKVPTSQNNEKKKSLRGMDTVLFDSITRLTIKVTNLITI